MPFQFSLAAVLLVRREREAAEERLLGAAERDLAGVRGQLQAVEGELRRIATERAGEGARVLQAVSLHEHYARLAVLNAARAELEGCVAEMETRRNARQQTYIVARRDRELLEELEAAQRASFLATVAKREQKRSDDLFLARRVLARRMRG